MAEIVITPRGRLWDHLMRGCILFLVATLSTGAVVRAQDTVQGWSGLDPSDLSTVFVLDDSGQEVTGQLLSLDSDALVILVEGQELRFETARVKRLDKRGDSLKNGAYIGAVVGLVMGILVARIADCVNDTGRVGSCGSGTQIGFAMLSTGLYSAIGVGIDALIRGRTTLYEAPDSSSARQDRFDRRGNSQIAVLTATLSW